MPYFALLDDAVSGRAVLFQNLQYSDRILSDGLDRLDGLLAQGWRRGLHLFLIADYGFGLPLQNRQPKAAPLPCTGLPTSKTSMPTNGWPRGKTVRPLASLGRKYRAGISNI